MGSTSQTSYFAKPKNPHDLTRVPGGSSGGGAASVAAGLCAFALGTDTGGSVRQPAAFCGITGLKPTYGAISRFGIVAYGSSLDQIGVLAECAEDCGLVMNKIVGADHNDMTAKDSGISDFTAQIGRPMSGLRVGLPKEFFGDEIDDDVKEKVMSAAKLAEQNGAVLVDVSLPSFKYGVSAYYLIACSEASSNLARFDGIRYGCHAEFAGGYDNLVKISRSRGFGPEVKRRILIGNYALSSGYYDAYYKKAQIARRKIRREYAEIFESADVILTPTSPTVAYKIGADLSDPTKMYAADVCTVTVNIAGLPAISTTCGQSADGLPIGVSVVGPKFSDDLIIGVASFFERHIERPRPAFYKGIF
jgi:aspartyl-tRNA(Asn)/glutamyl-tRNA(Gln) amidotransferase subunit A